MTPSEVRTMSDTDIVELLISLKPSDQAVAWLASVIADPTKVAAVNELSHRYAVKSAGGRALPRAKSAGTVLIDGAKFKSLMWRHRLPLAAVGPRVGKCSGYASVVAHKGRLSYWTADAIANELGMHIDAFIAAIASDEELVRLSA